MTLTNDPPPPLSLASWLTIHRLLSIVYFKQLASRPQTPSPKCYYKAYSLLCSGAWVFIPQRLPPGSVPGVNIHTYFHYNHVCNFQIATLKVGGGGSAHTPPTLSALWPHKCWDPPPLSKSLIFNWGNNDVFDDQSRSPSHSYIVGKDKHSVYNNNPLLYFKEIHCTINFDISQYTLYQTW